MRYSYLILTLLLALATACSGGKKEDTPAINAEGETAVPFTWPERTPIVSIVCGLTEMPAEGFTLVIENYYWDKFHTMAQHKVAGNSEVLHQLTENYPIGLYRVFFAEIKNARPVYFIVNGKDARIDINSTYTDFIEGRATIVPKDEVFVLNEAIVLHREKTETEEELKNALSDVTNINTRYYTLKDSLREEWELQRLRFYKQLETLSKSYPDAYATQAVVKLLRKKSRYENEALKEAYETEPAMLNRHYFDGVDINSTAYLGHPLFFQSVNEYLTEYAGERPGEWQTSIGYMMGHISNATVKETVADYLVFYYLDRNLDTLARTIAFTYIEGCSDDYFAQMKQSDRYRPGVQANTLMPPLVLPDQEGNVVDANKRFAENKITLLYFWKSSCTYCEAEHAVIQRLHNLYAAKGLGIIGVSLDIDKQAWRQTIEKHQMDWINLSDLKGSTSQAIYQYAIKNTPSTFIVNSKGVLVAKDIKGRSLLEFFNTYFEKQ